MIVNSFRGLQIVELVDSSLISRRKHVVPFPHRSTCIVGAFFLRTVQSRARVVA